MLGGTWRNFDIAAASIRRLLFSFDMRKRSSGGKEEEDREPHKRMIALALAPGPNNAGRSTKGLFGICLLHVSPFLFFFSCLTSTSAAAAGYPPPRCPRRRQGPKVRRKSLEKNHFNTMPTIQTPTSRRSEPLQPVKGDGGRLWQLQLPRRRPQGGGHSQRARPCRR